MTQPNIYSEDGCILLVNKPLKWTSFDVVKKIRGLFRLKKIGHAGTLDPLATGLLILGIGKKTKALSDLQGLDKEYTGTFTLGFSTPSYDLETEADETFSTEHITDELIYQTVKKFIGEQLQVPPAHSAVKIDGQRAYKKARKGEEVKLKSRQIIIHEFEIEKINLPDIHFKVSVSKGTYIRTLAHDFGKALQSGAHLSQLKRTMVGDFKVEDAYSLDELISLQTQIKESIGSYKRS